MQRSIYIFLCSRASNLTFHSISLIYLFFNILKYIIYSCTHSFTHSFKRSHACCPKTNISSFHADDCYYYCCFCSLLSLQHSILLNTFTSNLRLYFEDCCKGFTNECIYEYVSFILYICFRSFANTYVRVKQ